MVYNKNMISAQEISNILRKNGYQAWLVGGAVRDIILGLDPKDLDIATNARPADLKDIFTGVADSVNIDKGKTFGVAIIDGIEVATFRHDVHDGIGDENCSVRYADTLSEDLCRRDLTINAMAMDPRNGHIVDTWNGRQDLEDRLIRFVGDADQRIQEDPNRMIRAARFLAKIEGEFAPETLEALRRNVDLIDTHVAPERIRMELLKAMSVDTPSMFFAALETFGALEKIFPEISRSVDHEHGNWHTENVFEHQMLAGDYLNKRDPILRLTGFLHDYGKPQAFVENFDNPKKNFLMHEVIGRNLLKPTLEDLKFSKDEVDRMTMLVRSHMYVLSTMSDKAWRRLQLKFEERNVDWRDFLRMRMADRHAALAHPQFPCSDWRDWVRKFRDGIPENAAFNVHALAVSGGDLIKTFNLRPGPIVSDVQRGLLCFVIDEGFEFNTVEALAEEVHNILGE